MGGIEADPTDPKYSDNVVQRNGGAAMYKFDGVLPFTVVVGKRAGRFVLRVFQGDAHDRCGSLETLQKKSTRKTAETWQCRIM
ncbi:hypothetical protein AAVH_20215 [Aphelenchoides avenae]|nr:hypothetical protein AAVH_20215 [Aphelenchus avenae]